MSDGERRKLAGDLAGLFPELLAEWFEQNDRPKGRPAVRSPHCRPIRGS